MKKLIAEVIQEQETRVIFAEEKLSKLQSIATRNGMKHEVRMTNEDLFLDIIEQEDSMVVAMARTMLMTSADIILANKEAVIKQHEHGIINGEYVIYCAEIMKKRFNQE